MPIFVGMIDTKIPFTDLPLFNNLIRDYISDKAKFDDIPTYPKSSSFEEIGSKKCHRKLLNERLLTQNKNIVLDEKSKKNIAQLTLSNCMTVTTGHQLCLMTGPMYFINKICSTIALANHLNEKQTDIHYVPIYWMASEDHDFEEVNHFHLFGKTHQWENNMEGAVGDLPTDGILPLLEHIQENHQLGNAATDFIKLAQKAYETQTLSDATRYFVNELFKGTGLVILDGNDPVLKKAMVPYFEEELIKNTSFKSVSQSNKKLASQGYSIQVNPREINLFYLQKNSRQRIIKRQGKYHINNTDLIFTEEGILEELTKYPEKFSPNVILRPLYQEIILPNIAYVGGGGEISYWLQLTQMFQDFSVDYPFLLVRDSAMFVSKKNSEIKEKHGLTWGEFFLNEDELAKKLVPKEELFEFSIYGNQLQEMYSEMAEKLEKSLRGTIESEKTKALKGIKNIEKRNVKILKTQNEVAINRVLKAKKQLFPSGKLQERYSNYLELLATFDKALTPWMIKSMNPLEKNFHFYNEE